MMYKKGYRMIEKCKVQEESQDLGDASILSDFWIPPLANVPGLLHMKDVNGVGLSAEMPLYRGNTEGFSGQLRAKPVRGPDMPAVTNLPH